MFKVADYPGYPGHIEKHLSKIFLLLQSSYQYVQSSRLPRLPRPYRKFVKFLISFALVDISQVLNMFKVADYPGYPGHIEKHLSKF